MLNSRLIMMMIIWLKKNEEPPLPEGVGTSGYVNMSNVMISYDSMGKRIKSWNSHQMANIWLGL